MPSADELSLRPAWLNNGQSPFARPVAAVTAYVQTLPWRLARAFHAWNHGDHSQPGDHWYSRPDWEMRKQEERYARATDLADLEGMERAFNRRDEDSMRNWDWR